MGKIASTLIWWICQNILTYLTLILIYYGNLYGKKLCKFNGTGIYIFIYLIYISYWQNYPQHSQKLKFYRSFKTDHTTSSYLDLTRGTAGRRAFVKLLIRISNHKLMIEISRYYQATKDNRHWPFCGSNLIEDEAHFLFRCPTYFMIRNNFYNEIKTLIPNITQLPVNV